MTTFGLGLAALGRPAYINVGRAEALPAERSVDAMRAASWAVLDSAYDSGVRWVDAARSYGLAEEFLAGWLDRRGHRDVTVSSKWGYAYVGGWRLDAEVHEAKEHSLARFRRQYRESRELLGGHLTVYQVHSLVPDSPLFEDGPLLEALAAAAADGVRIGFSTSGPGQARTIRRALDVEVSGRPLFSTVQSTWNLLEPSVGPALGEARARGLHVIVKEGLGNGRLAVEPPAALHRLADRLGVTADAVSLAAIAAQPWAGTVLSGAADPHQLISNLRAGSLALGRGDLDALSSLSMDPERYWAERGRLPWS
ncbi:aldo/keto reductase [Actinomadura parmotrematis]|uniref:Aldo/keto reductase n=1 Tax=Actinomadura parmotrematis TaxID=2864039 RepID=A0ABS7G2P9_9ACTN|nr:aldo/keto reductase [Actinomadura parmotrematis]MBW8486144.1 aldo/keto reductase [Actinomadura parmotrematis]